MSNVLVGLGLDVLALLVLVGWLYRRRPSAPEMTMVFAALNMGLFTAVVSIGSGKFPVGVGFGLFGLLSLVRLRSTAFSVKDVAYTFTALVLALINAMHGHPLWLAPVLDVVLLLTIALVDDTRSATTPEVVRLTLDRALSRPEDVHARVTEVLGHAPSGVRITKVDLVRDLTEVVVRHEVPDAGVPVAVLGRQDDDD